MASFVNGSGSLGSSTLENALWEACTRAALLDSALGTPTGNITEDIQPGGAAVAINAVIPVDVSTVSGKFTLTARDFLSAAFDPGTGGTLNSTSFPAAILELATKIQELEFDQAQAVVNLTFNADAGTATVVGTLPITRTITAAGAQSYIADEYLT